MMVICKGRIERNQQRQQMGAEAAAVVESDIANLLAGKSYEHLVTLQRQIQTKLASREPMDVEYWEGLLKKLLVYKAQVSFPPQSQKDPTNALRSQNSRPTTRSLSKTDWSSFANDSATKPCKHSKSFSLAQPHPYLSTKSRLQLNKNLQPRRLNHITGR
jgi:hypothetical protein